jgi:hypothetical protein
MTRLIQNLRQDLRFQDDCNCKVPAFHFWFDRLEKIIRYSIFVGISAIETTNGTVDY